MWKFAPGLREERRRHEREWRTDHDFVCARRRDRPRPPRDALGIFEAVGFIFQLPMTIWGMTWGYSNTNNNF